MVGWPHQLDGHESEQVLGTGDGQGPGMPPLGQRVNFSDASVGSQRVRHD